MNCYSFASISIYVFFILIYLCLLLCTKTHVRKREGKPEGGPNGHLLCSFSQAEEGQYGNCFQLQSLQILPDSISASLTLPERFCMGPRPFSMHQSVDAKQSNYNSCPNCRTHCLSKPRLQQGLLLSAVAEELKIGIKSYRATDGKQDRSNDTQTSDPYTNHTN